MYKGLQVAALENDHQEYITLVARSIRLTIKMLTLGIDGKISVPADSESFPEFCRVGELQVCLSKQGLISSINKFTVFPHVLMVYSPTITKTYEYIHPKLNKT